MAISDLELSSTLPLADIHSALAGRATRTEQIAQSVVFLRQRALSATKIEEHLGIDEEWLTRGEALLFEAEEALDSELGEGWELLAGRRPNEMPVGRLIIKMHELMIERVRHAEQIAYARMLDDRLSLREVRETMGLGRDKFDTALRWLRDAGLTIRED